MESEFVEIGEVGDRGANTLNFGTVSKSSYLKCERHFHIVADLAHYPLHLLIVVEGDSAVSSAVLDSHLQLSYAPRTCPLLHSRHLSHYQGLTDHRLPQNNVVPLDG